LVSSPNKGGGTIPASAAILSRVPRLNEKPEGRKVRPIQGFENSPTEGGDIHWHAVFGACGGGGGDLFGVAGLEPAQGG